MALMEDRSALSGLSDLRKDKGEEKGNLWKKILAEVQSSDHNKLPSCKSALVLGENESGKTTLIAKLQGNEDPKKGSGLEYAYIDVRDEYRDDHTRLGVWILDGDKSHAELLDFSISEETYEYTLVILTVSMTTPWSIMDQLHSWVLVLQDHIDKLKISPDELKERQNRNYIEPGDELDASSPMKRSSRNFDGEDDPVLPLPEGVLHRNLGLHLVVVVTKTDYMSTLEKDFDYKEEHFDFIQQSIRKFCLQYGASLFYTSVKEDKNCDLLYKYLVHKIYNFPFRTPALVVEKDAVFIPSGWDNLKKISILYENMHSVNPDDYYTDVIVKPQIVRKAVTRECELQAEDEQSFLARHQAQLQSGAANAASGTPNRQDVTIRQSPSTPKTVTRVPVQTTPNPMQSPKKIEPSKTGTANEGVLANFFNSLLNKKTSPMSPNCAIKSNGTSIVSPLRSDAAAELDRLSKGKKATSTSGPPSLTLNNSTLETSSLNSSEC